MNFKNGWLYGLIVFLAQTCNPYYQASNQQQYIPEEAIVFEDMEIEMDEEVEMTVPSPEVAPPPPAQTGEDQIFKVVESMPRFPGCEGKGLENHELKKCSEEEMLKYLKTNLNYPRIAREYRMEGKVIIQFVVERDGSISTPQVIKAIGGGCGRETVRLVTAMPKWIPGKQRGQPVRVQYTLPVTFKIDDDDDLPPMFMDQDIEEEEIKEIPPSLFDQEVEVEEEPIEELIFKVVEDMPRFPGCENQGLNRTKLKNCSQDKLKAYIKANLKYPDTAKQDNIKGKVILQFVVAEDGSISNTRILRDIGGGCGEEAVRVVKSMPKWISGKQRGQPVKVQYTLPVTFKL